MSVSEFLHRLLPRRERARVVELEPIHQRILRGLRRFGVLDFSRIAAEISAEHPTITGDVLLALVKLEHDGLITREQKPEQTRQTASYALTPDGQRVAGLLPQSATSSIDFRL